MSDSALRKIMYRGLTTLEAYIANAKKRILISEAQYQLTKEYN